MSADPGPPYFCLSGHEHPTVVETLKCDQAWEDDQDERDALADERAEREAMGGDVTYEDD